MSDNVLKIDITPKVVVDKDFEFEFNSQVLKVKCLLFKTEFLYLWSEYLRILYKGIDNVANFFKEDLYIIDTIYSTDFEVINKMLKLIFKDDYNKISDALGTDEYNYKYLFMTIHHEVFEEQYRIIAEQINGEVLSNKKKL